MNFWQEAIPVPGLSPVVHQTNFERFVLVERLLPFNQTVAWATFINCFVLPDVNNTHNGLFVTTGRKNEDLLRGQAKNKMLMYGSVFDDGRSAMIELKKLLEEVIDELGEFTHDVNGIVSRCHQGMRVPMHAGVVNHG